MIPAEAVEAAARAAYEFRFCGHKAWGDLTPLAQCDAEAEMQYALLAAAPHMLAGAWEEGRDAEFQRSVMKRQSDPNPYRPTP